MKKIGLLLCLFSSFVLSAQHSFFKVYEDSAALVNDASHIVDDFVQRVNRINPVITAKPMAVLNTKPYLIFYSANANKINLPIWHQVIPPQKQFFYQLSGSEKGGEEVFGLFFNGFYLPHEMGHALQAAVKKRDSSLYANEYFANVVSILYWREVNRTKELEQCYQFAKKFVSQLKDPAPEGADAIQYFNTHYNELGADPYKYAYYQFRQFIQIYEDKSIGDFKSWIQQYLSKAL